VITVIHVDTERTWRGGEKQVFNLATKLPSSQFRSVIAAPVKSALYDKAVKAGIPVIALRSAAEVSFRQYADIKKGVEYHNADLIHVHTSHGLISAALVRKYSKIPLKVVYSRRTDFHLRTSVLNISQRKYLWGADRIISVSDGIKRVLASDGIPERKVTTIYSGIDLDSFVPHELNDSVRMEFNIPRNIPLIGMVAALVNHKDPLNYLKAAEIVGEKNPDAIFLLIGAGKMWEEMELLLKESKMRDRFIMTGFRRDVPRLLSALDIFCMTSREEGLCTSILDAMAMEIPVVATFAGGIPEAVKDGYTGLLAPIEDSPGIAEKILFLLNNRDLAIKMGKAGRERVEEIFDVQTTVLRTAEVYRNLIHE